MKYIARIHNWFVDFDFFWWPFSFLKPKQNELMDWSKVTQMSAYFGILIWIFISGFSIAQMGFDFQFVAMNFFGSILSLFLWFGLVTKPLWNYRAKRLKG